MLYQILACTINVKNKIKKSYKNNEFNISGWMSNEKLELTNGSYSVPDIQDYFEYIIKKYNQWLIILQQEYADKIHNRIAFKIKTGYYLELVTPETVKLLGSTKK